MKKHIIIFSLLLCVGATLQAQWSTMEMYRFIDPIAFSQAAPGGSAAHNLWLGYQQNGDNNSTRNGQDDFALTSQFLNLNTGGLGLGRRIGWGLRLSHSSQHTDRRLGFSPVFGAKIIETQRLQIGTGISFGFLNYGTSYNGVYVNQAYDPLLDQVAYNYWELDAGVGLSARFQLPWMKIDAALSTAQLPGNFLSDPLPVNNRVYANYQAGGGVFFNPIYNVWVGPRAHYKNILPREGVGAQAGGLDLGLQVLLDRQKMWFASAYRPAAGQVMAGFGMQVIRPDSQARFGFGVDIQGMGSYPINTAKPGIGQYVGPTIELGLSFSFLRKSRQDQSKTDTLHWAEDFWDNDGAINAHRVRYFDEAGPTSLVASTSVVRQHVALTYSFPDNSFLFLGEGGVIYKDSLISDLGEEWLGVDALLENLSNRIIDEAFHPDSTNVRDPENLEPLKKLLSFQLSTHVSFDERAIDFVAGETRYEGEIDSKNDIYDTLYVRVNYNGSDTTIGVPKGGFVTNLQLATLKLHAMRKKLEYELRKNHRHQFLFLWEGQVPTDEEINSGLPIVRIKTPRIIPNNPNQQADYRHEVTIRFERDKKYVKGTDEEEEEFWGDESDPTKTKSKRKHPKKAKKKKPAKEAKPASLPEQFPTNEEEGTFEAAPEPEEQPEEEAPSQDLFDDGGGN